MAPNTPKLQYGEKHHVDLPMESKLRLYLHTESQEPAFLRRLRNQYGSGDTSTAQRQAQRPRKRVLDTGEDDGPIYVLEGTDQTLTSIEVDALTGTTKGAEVAENNGETLQDNTQRVAATSTNLADGTSSNAAASEKSDKGAIGQGSKKRTAKAIGVDREGTEEEQPNKVRDRKKIKSGKLSKTKLSFQSDD